MIEYRDEKEETKETEVLEPQIEFIVPRCCREGWETCVHGVPKLKKKKVNRGL